MSGARRATPMMREGVFMREGALSRPDAERLVEAAAAAPSARNLQPWRFVARLSDRVIEIYADPSRALRRSDPQGRAVHMACAAALFNLRLAIAHENAEPIARLLPNPRDPLLLAAVRIGGPHRPGPDEQDLHAAIHAGRGTAQPHNWTRTAAPSLLAALAEAAALEGASLTILDRAQALRFLRSAAVPNRSPHARLGYLGALADFSPDQADGPWLGPPGPGGHLVVVSTTADDRASWLRAGQALQRVLLLATHAGVPAVALGPAPALGAARRGPDARVGHRYPEIIARLGPDLAGPAARPSQRRPLGQVMRVVGGAPGRRDEGPRAALPLALPLAGRQLLSSK